jgi:hypothetical protein
MAKTKASYFEKLRDPRWQQMRLNVMGRDGFQCRDCLSKEKTLNVHHAYYEKGKDPWDYHPDSLVTLCEDCHAVAEKRKRWILEFCADPQNLKNVVRLTDILAANGPFGFDFSSFLDSVLDFSEAYQTEALELEWRREMLVKLKSSAAQITFHLVGAIHEAVQLAERQNG